MCLGIVPGRAAESKRSSSFITYRVTCTEVVLMDTPIAFFLADPDCVILADSHFLSLIIVSRINNCSETNLMNETMIKPNFSLITQTLTSS